MGSVLLILLRIKIILFWRNIAVNLSDYRKILVTGTQRSGTTWLGNILSAGDEVGYIHEPFNTTNAKIHKSPIFIPYQYINDQIDKDEDSIYSNYINYFLNPGVKFFMNSFGPIRNIDSRYILPGKQILLNGWSNKMQIIKDPFALLSSEWMYHQLGWEIVIIVRHPAAFVLSMVEKKWTVASTVFEKQLNDLKYVYSNHMELVSAYINKPNKRNDLVGCAIMGWQLLHIAIDYFRNQYPDWIIVRHEDISKTPLEYSEKLYNKLQLPYSDAIRKSINKSISGETVNGTKRDPIKNMEKWRAKLDSNTIERIKRETYTIGRKFYSDYEW
jgi:hypothetical protein